MKLTKANVTRTLKAAGHTQATGKRNGTEGFSLVIGYGGSVIVRIQPPDSTCTREQDQELLQQWEAALAPRFRVDRQQSRLLVSEKDEDE